MTRSTMDVHLRTAVGAAMLLAVGACADAATGPEAGPSAAGLASPLGVLLAHPQHAVVCQSETSPAGTYHFVVTVAGTINHGDHVVPELDLVVPDHPLHPVCADVYTRTEGHPTADHGALVTVTQADPHHAALFDHITARSNGPAPTIDAEHHAATMFVNAFHTSEATFHAIVDPHHEAPVAVDPHHGTDTGTD